MPIRWLHLPRSPWGILLRCDLFRKKNRPEKFPFIATNNWIVLAVPMSVKYFFAPNSSYSKRVVEKKRREAITKRFAFQTNAKGEIWLHWENFAKLLSCNSWPPPLLQYGTCLEVFIKVFSLMMWRFFKSIPNSK